MLEITMLNSLADIGEEDEFGELRFLPDAEDVDLVTNY